MPSNEVYWRKRAYSYEQQLCKIARYLGGDATMVVTGERSIAGLVKQRVRQQDALDRLLPLCPDHRDKQRGKPCLACRIEQLEHVLSDIQRLSTDSFAADKATLVLS